MKWQSLIWLFLLAIFSPLLGRAQSLEAPPEMFQNLKLGMTLTQVINVLKEQRVFISEQAPQSYRLSVSIYDLLGGYDPKHRFIDSEDQRIYYDDQVFFDLRNIHVANDEYTFSYDDPYYMIEFPHIASYSVAYANRLNPLLYSLKVKFFEDQLYAIEYRVQLSFLDFNRLQNNYFKRYGRILTPGDQTVAAKGVSTLVRVDRNDVTIIRIDQNLQAKIFSYLQKQTNRVLVQLYDQVSRSLRDGKKSKLEILKNKKEQLVVALRRQFQSVDML